MSSEEGSVSEFEYCSDEPAEEEETIFNDSFRPSLKVITKESLIAAQNDILRQVAEMLGIKKQHSRTLLIHHRWDIDRLSGVFAEKGRDRLFLEAGVPLEASLSVAPNPQPDLSVNVVTCGTCYDEVPNARVSTMDCGHSFCNECWTQYFLIMVREGQSRRIKCMAHQCNSVCDEDIVRKLVFASDSEAGQKFEQFLLESYIEDNGKVKWCPSVPHCGNAICVKDDPFVEIECICGHQFCFNCSSEPHFPCTCSMWELWDKKCKDESETNNWLTAHTKPCPKCQKPVEKNGGCNLVGCICGQSFCWLCGAATGREHSLIRIVGHSCGRYKEDKEKEAERAQRDLNRYIHYQSRFQAHMSSLKLEEKQREVMLQNIAKREESESVVKDYSWLVNGLHLRYRARKALSYSYAFAFYMFGEELFKEEMTLEEKIICQNLFEDQQQQLEFTVERLSKAIETPFHFRINDSQISQARLNVINLASVTDNLCRKMYECVENDLLGRLHLPDQHISKYSSKGVEKVTEKIEDRHGDSTFNESGGKSMAAVQNPSSSRKRRRHDIDLNSVIADSGI